MKNKTKEQQHKIFMKKMDKYVEESEFMPIAVFMDGGQFDGVSYCGEFLKLLEEHENNLINNSRLSALNEVQEIIEKNKGRKTDYPKVWWINCDILNSEIEKLKNGK
jgi:hypothetical protein